MPRLRDDDLRAEVARLRASEEYEFALALVEAARQERDSLTATFLYAGLLRALGRRTEADDIYASLDPDDVEGDDRVHLLLAQASGSIAAGHRDAAIDRLRTAVSSDPHYDHGRLALALAEQAGGPDTVLEVLDAALSAEDPGRWHSAVEAALQGPLHFFGDTEVPVKGPLIHVAHARVAKATGDEDRLAEEVDRVLSGPIEQWAYDALCRLRHPLVMRLASRRADDLVAAGNLDRALGMRELAVDAAAALGPGFELEEAMLRHRLAEARVGDHDLDGARVEHERAVAMVRDLDIDTRSRATMLCALGRVLLACEAAAEAAEPLTTALALAREMNDRFLESHILHEHAKLAWKQGRRQEALELLDHTGDLTPERRPFLARTRTAILDSEGRLDDAITAARAAVELAEAGTSIAAACQLDLAEILARNDDNKAEAITLARAVLANRGARNDSRLRAEELLTSLIDE